MSKAPVANEDQKQAYLTIDQIRSAPDMEPEDVRVPQWGGKVKVRPFSIKERKAIRKRAESKVIDEETGLPQTTYDIEEMEVQAVIVACLEPRFDVKDAVWLREEKSSGAVSKIANRIFAISGMGREAEGKLES